MAAVLPGAPAIEARYNNNNNNNNNNSNNNNNNNKKKKKKKKEMGLRQRNGASRSMNVMCTKNCVMRVV
jgi:hypothetical protein